MKHHPSWMTRKAADRTLTAMCHDWRTDSAFERRHATNVLALERQMPKLQPCGSAQLQGVVHFLARSLNAANIHIQAVQIGHDSQTHFASKELLEPHHVNHAHMPPWSIWDK